MTGTLTASWALSLLSATALGGSLAACSADEPEIETVDPNDLDPEVLEPEEAGDGDPQGGGVCDLLSAEEIETVLAEPVGEGQGVGETGEVESCLWPHAEDEQQGVQVLSISDDDIPGEELFASVANGETTQVPGAEEAIFDEEKQSLWVLAEQTVLQLNLSAFDAGENEFVDLAEMMVENR